MLSVEELVDRLIDLSFAEDIGDGTCSSRKTVFLPVLRWQRKCSVVSTPT